MKIYMVEVEEVADVLYKVVASSPEAANRAAAAGKGLEVDRLVARRELVCGEELDD